jgi:hypothetical protein
VRRSQCPSSLRRRSAAARLLILWVRIPPGAWISVCCECCMLSGRGVYDEMITRPEESYRLWCVVVWSRNLVNEETLTQWGLLRQKKEKKILICSLMTALLQAETCSWALWIIISYVWLKCSSLLLQFSNYCNNMAVVGICSLPFFQIISNKPMAIHKI